MTAPTRRAAFLAAIGASAGLAMTGAAASAPPRIVSLNPCLDAILVRVADRGQIAALSHFSRDPAQSGIAALARTLPFTYESAEEVIALRPDLVLASDHTALATLAALQRLHIRLEAFPVPSTVAQSLDQVRRIARLAGHPERGAALVRKIQQSIAAASVPPGFSPIPALIFEPGGLSPGDGVLIDEMLRRTGFRNIAARYGLSTWGKVPLERLIADPPKVLLGPVETHGAATWSERTADHPALAALKGRMIRAAFPERLLYCGGPTLIDTAAALADARCKVMGQGG